MKYTTRFNQYTNIDKERHTLNNYPVISKERSNKIYNIKCTENNNKLNNIR